jgi:hypothetical protein
MAGSRTDLFKAMAGASVDGVQCLGHTKGNNMFTMMESLEGRQMFSVASPGTTELPAPVVAADTSAPADDTSSTKLDKSSPKLYSVCCTGKHIATGVISV